MSRLKLLFVLLFSAVAIRAADVSLFINSNTRQLNWTNLNLVNPLFDSPWYSRVFVNGGTNTTIDLGHTAVTYWTNVTANARFQWSNKTASTNAYTEHALVVWASTDNLQITNVVDSYTVVGGAWGTLKAGLNLIYFKNLGNQWVVYQPEATLIDSSRIIGLVNSNIQFDPAQFNTNGTQVHIASGVTTTNKQTLYSQTFEGDQLSYIIDARVKMHYLTPSANFDFSLSNKPSNTNEPTTIYLTVKSGLALTYTNTVDSLSSFGNWGNLPIGKTVIELGFDGEGWYIFQGNSSIATTNIGPGTVNDTEFSYLDGLTGITGTGKMVRSINPLFDGYLDYTEIATPATPSAGSLRIYSKSDHKLYKKDSSGTETEIGSTGGGTGDVAGPAGATDNSLARFDTGTGKLLQDSPVTVDDSGNISTPGSVSMTGTGDGGVNLFHGAFKFTLAASPSLGADLKFVMPSAGGNGYLLASLSGSTVTLSYGTPIGSSNWAGNGSTNSDLVGNGTLNGLTDTNFFRLLSATASKPARFDANKNLTNGVIDLASGDITGLLPRANISGNVPVTPTTVVNASIPSYNGTDGKTQADSDITINSRTNLVVPGGITSSNGVTVVGTGNPRLVLNGTGIGGIIFSNDSFGLRLVASPSMTETMNIILPTSTTSELLKFVKIGTNTYLTNAVAGVDYVSTNKTYFEFAIGDETTALTSGQRISWHLPFACTITGVRASLTTASSSGVVTFDIKEAGTSIFSTKLTIDASEETSVTAATPYVLSDTSLADDAKLTGFIDTTGTGATGAKIKIFYKLP